MAKQVNGYAIVKALDSAHMRGALGAKGHYLVKAAIRAAQMRGRPVRNMADLERALREYSGPKGVYHA